MLCTPQSGQWLVLTWVMLCPSPQVSNRVPISSWHGDPQDQELLRLIPVLEKLSQAVRTGAAPVLGGEAARLS